MKRTLGVLAMICWMHTASAQEGKGIQFFRGTWAEAKAAAKQQHKMIFVDAYTDWCGPCKQMDKFVFPQEEVGSTYNESFINVKLNAEKGEGPRIADTFNIRAYPTFLFLNSEGSLVMKIIGEKDAEGMNRLADSARKITEQRTLGDMEKMFKDGSREPAFLKAYLARLRQMQLDNTPVLDAYFSMLPLDVLKKEETLVYLGNNLFGTQSYAFRFLMNQYASLGDAAKEKIKDDLYKQIIDRSFPNAIMQKRVAEAEMLLAYTTQINFQQETQQAYMDRLRLVYYDLVKDTAGMKAAAYRWIGRIPQKTDEAIRKEDARRYAIFIEPFRNGKMDSTRIVDFKLENESMKTAMSNDISYRYYYPASLFNKLPDGDKKALQDALQWVTRAYGLMPSQKMYKQLMEELKTKVDHAN